MEEISLDYLAGLIDADGCISISKMKASSLRRAINPAYAAMLCVANTNSKLLHDLQEQFGGSIVKDGRGTCARWIVHTLKACYLLELLLPRLRVKRRQAFLCLELHSGIRPHGDATSEEELERREAIYVRNKELNSGSYGKAKSNY